MGFRMLVKSNIPRVDLQSYILLLAGTYKSGKTRLYKELIEYMYPDDTNAGVLVAWEGGYKSWHLKAVIDLTEYRKPDEFRAGKLKKKSEIEFDADRWVYFKKDIVDELVQESREGRTSKIIAMDTVDRMIDCASAHIITEANLKYAGNGFTSIQELSESKVYKENVWNNLYDELKRPMDTLRAAGYGLIYLAWTKEKTTELIDGLKYNSIELMMNATCRKVFQSQADLICCLHNEATAVDKTGKELTKNAENKAGKEIATNFHETETYMYFRESNYVGVAGGRFKHLPEKVLYSVDNFVDVFKEAVEGQLNGTESVENLRESEVQAREDKAQAYSEEKVKEIKQEAEEEAEGLSIKELIEAITKEVDRFTSSPVLTEKIVPAFAKIFGKNYKNSDDIAKLNEGLAYIRTVPTPVTV